jgi:ankyrin repeat protein
MIAVARGKTASETIEYLLSEGANIDKPASNGSTALHLAAYWGYQDIVKILVERGAALDAKNKRGLTPLDQAASFGYADVSKYLSDKSGVPIPKVKSSKQPKKADAVVPDAVPTPEIVSKSSSMSSSKSSSK